MSKIVKVIILDKTCELLVYINNNTQVFNWSKVLENNIPCSFTSLQAIMEYYEALIKSGYNGLMEVVYE